MTARDYLLVSCRDGHKYDQFRGGKNAGCELGTLCSCSVPVYECFCGDCDYGENDEAREIIRECRERQAEEQPSDEGAP